MLFVSLLAASACLGGCWILNGTATLPEELVTNRPNQVEEDGYASSRACRACHPSEYASWHGSYHRTMTQVATPQSVVPSFDGIRIDNVYGSAVRLERQGDQFLANFADPDWHEPAGDRPHIQRRVVMITGSHNQQVYWYETGHDRVLGQLPVAYLIGEQRWIPRRAAVLHPPADPVFSETGHWNSTCIACHATHGKPEFDTPFGSRPIEQQTVQTSAAEFGIACEACHGASEEHTRLNRSPLRRYWFHLTGQPDPTTVVPTRLNPRLSSQVCGQCHGVWEFYDLQGERLANSTGLPYKPGDQLTATRFMAQPTRNREADTMKTLLAEDQGFINDSFWSDGMVRVTGREYNGLIESPCFKNATDDQHALSCFSCHTMHKQPDDARSMVNWADTQLTPRMDGNEACLQCHTLPSLDASASARTSVASAPAPTSVASAPARTSVASAPARTFVASAPARTFVASAPARTFVASDFSRTSSVSDAALTAHTKHRADSPGSSCYNCHMPYTTYGLLKTMRSHQVSSPSVAVSLATGRPNACNLCHLDKTLGWTSQYLNQWYGTPAPALADDDRSVAASVLWLLRGDAAQRVIVAQALGWQPAQQISGTSWMPFYLAQLLDDPYEAIRFVAYRALRGLPGFGDIPYDFVAQPRQRLDAAMKTIDRWRSRRPADGSAATALLFNPDGTPRADVVARLLMARDHRRVLLRE